MPSVLSTNQRYFQHIGAREDWSSIRLRISHEIAHARSPPPPRQREDQGRDVGRIIRHRCRLVDTSRIAPYETERIRHPCRNVRFGGGIKRIHGQGAGRKHRGLGRRAFIDTTIHAGRNSHGAAEEGCGQVPVFPRGSRCCPRESLPRPRAKRGVSCLSIPCDDARGLARTVFRCRQRRGSEWVWCRGWCELQRSSLFLCSVRVGTLWVCEKVDSGEKKGGSLRKGGNCLGKWKIV
mmetsp:Transcript_3839/g.6801  ORF Transcript_3839/g.6801 Transcript_3839/m.6801 type:complete len:236 (+) Transcript_3839:407-1114(+)